MTIRTLDEIGTLQLGAVQKTLLTHLCARADQFGRSDAIVIDDAAKQLVDAIAYDFDKIRRFPNTLTGCAIRAAIMDEWIQDFLRAHPAGSIGLFGVGLDTVFEPNDNGRANWFEFDFPDVITLRETCFAPDARRQLIAGDILDTRWIDRVQATARGSWLFQAAGLLMYLQPAEVQHLFRLLAERFPGATCLFDGCSQFAKQNSHRWEATIRTTAAKYHWAIDDPRDLAAWDNRIRVTDVRYMLDHHRHQWHWATCIWSRLLPKLRKAYHINWGRLADINLPQPIRAQARRVAAPTTPQSVPVAIYASQLLIPTLATEQLQSLDGLSLPSGVTSSPLDHANCYRDHGAGDFARRSPACRVAQTSSEPIAIATYSATFRAV